MSIFSSLGGLFGGGSNYNKYADQMAGQASKYDPFINTGKDAMNEAFKQFMMGAQNPNQVYNNLASGFQNSPYQTSQLNSLSNMMNTNAANTGMLGSTSANNALADHLSQQQNQYYNDYLNRMFGIYNNSLSGLNNEGNMGLGALGNQIGVNQEGYLGRVQGGMADQDGFNKIAGWIMGKL